MAEAIAIRNAFQVHMHLSAAAATELTGDQGIDSVDELIELNDDRVETLCKILRRPGGGQAGHIVSLRAEESLKLAVYYCRFRVLKTSRPTTSANLTRDNIRSIRELKEWEANHVDPDPAEGIINPKDWHRTMEALQEYFRNCLGVTKIPLAYVLRADEAPTADPATGWPTMQDEMIGRAPIRNATGGYAQTYLTDRETVWNKIADLTRTLPCWTYVKPAQRTRDGRAAFLALKNHFLGENVIDTFASSAEAKLANLTYNGETRRWNFEKYASAHLEQHTVLEELHAQGRHAGIDERAKVRHLMDGVKTSKLDTVKTSILADATLRNDFAAAAKLYTDFIQASATTSTNNPGTANISAVRTGDANSNKRKIHADEVKDRYYKHKD